MHVSASFRVFPVVPDVLHVVVVLEHIQHLLHVLDIVLVRELDVAVLGQHFDLGGQELVACLTANYALPCRAVFAMVYHHRFSVIYNSRCS